MKNHTKVYFSYFRYDISDVILCEVCGSVGVDVAHINGKKMGGDPQGKKDVISNLACLCRSCHYKLDFSMELSKEFVQARHDEKLKKHKL
jgi:predicted restriction endonuclease